MRRSTKYRKHGRSLFLCPECNEIENKKIYSPSKEWERWLKELYDAGIPVEAHRKMREATTGLSKNLKLSILIEEYAIFTESDENFMRFIL